MEGRNLIDLAEGNIEMRCLDLYGNRPERDGNILIGILVGKCISFYTDRLIYKRTIVVALDLTYRDFNE